MKTLASRPSSWLELADGLEERQAFDVADGAADFAQHEVDIVRIGLHEILDGVGDVRNHLQRRAQIIARGARVSRIDL